MSSFALPIPGYRLGIHRRKRQRSGNDYGGGGDGGDDDDGSETEWGGGASQRSPSPSGGFETAPATPSSSRMPSLSINPLSHSPDTLRQLTVAGAPTEDEIPGHRVPGFPHKPLPRGYPKITSTDRRRQKKKKNKNKEHNKRSTSAGGPGTSEDENSKANAATTTRGNERSLAASRIQHLRTMLAILHRCLSEGDIPRARRALGLLLQTEDVDIRLNNLWRLGAEILMREGEEPQGQGQEHGGGGKEKNGKKKKKKKKKKTLSLWGETANPRKIRDFFEHLANNYPHDPHRPHLTSAVDFWPVWAGLEIWMHCHLGYEVGRRKLLDQAGGLLEEEEYDEWQDEEEKTEVRKERKKTFYASLDLLRKQTMEALQEVDGRLEKVVMPSNSSSNSSSSAARQRGGGGWSAAALAAQQTELLRQRGMISLAMGDLRLPGRVVERWFEALEKGGGGGEEEEDFSEDVERLRGKAVGWMRGGGGGGGGRVRYPRLSLRDQGFRDLAEEEEEERDEEEEEDEEEQVAVAAGWEERIQRALDARAGDHKRARVLFRKVLDGGGDLEEWVRRFIEVEDEEDEEEEDEDDEDGYKMA